MKFLYKEHKLREEGSRESLTSELDKLQWHMLYKVLNELICKLKSKTMMKGSDKYKKIIRRARKEILVRTQWRKVSRISGTLDNLAVDLCVRLPNFMYRI